MLYGFRKDGLETVVTASHGNTPILYKWYEDLAKDDDTFIGRRQTEFMDKFTHEFGRVREDVFVFSHKDTAQQEAFITKYQITILNPQNAWDRHDDMVDFDAPDYYDVSETRTIEELEGLTEGNDRWDRRTDEQKEADKKMKEMIEQLKKDGQMSSDGSFSRRKPKKGEGDLAHVDEIRTTRNADGTISIDNVLARKDYSNLREDAKQQEQKDSQQGEKGADPA
jgi:hypothetical protein